MKLAVAIALLASVACVMATDPPSAVELARHLDEMRRPARSFELHLTLQEWRNGQKDHAAEYQVFARRDGEDFFTLTRCLAPEEDRNKVLLARGRELWLFDPKSARPTRIPPQRLRAKTWDIDVLSSSFVTDYEPEFLGEENATDAARKERACHHLKLTLHDKGNPTAPAAIEYWVDRETQRPVEARFFNAAGKMLRTLHYANFVNALGAWRPGRAFVTGIQTGLVEELRFSEMAYRDLPERLFTIEALAQISRGEAP